MGNGQRLLWAVIPDWNTQQLLNQLELHSSRASNTFHLLFAPALPKIIASLIFLKTPIKQAEGDKPQAFLHILIQPFFRLEIDEIVSDTNKRVAIHIRCSQTFAIPSARSINGHNLLLEFGNHHVKI